jgi:hypothetical protein
MTIKKRENIGNYNRKHDIVLSGELAVERAMDL